MSIFDNYGNSLELVKEEIRSQANALRAKNAIEIVWHMDGNELVTGAAYQFDIVVKERCSLNVTWRCYWQSLALAIASADLTMGGVLSTPTAPTFVVMFPPNPMATGIQDGNTVFEIPTGGASPMFEIGTVLRITIAMPLLVDNLMFLPPKIGVTF